METLAALPRSDSLEQGPGVRLLLADDDARMRSLLASCAREVVGAIAVLEAEDCVEAVRLGFRLRPQIAFLDVDLPKLGGIEVALRLRELQPRTRLALQAGDLRSHRERARAQRLPLFNKLELDRAVSWLELQVESCAGHRSPVSPPHKRSLDCASCGYGIACLAAPVLCPMCQAENAWIPARWRPFGRSVGSLP